MGPRSEEEAHGLDQEVEASQEGGRTGREAPRRQDTPTKHDHRPRNDRIDRRYLQRKMFCGAEMKPEMVGMYLGEFAITYKPVRHGRSGISASHQTRFIPL